MSRYIYDSDDSEDSDDSDGSTRIGQSRSEVMNEVKSVVLTSVTY